MNPKVCSLAVLLYSITCTVLIPAIADVRSKAERFTEEGLFTQGIEGPAVDKQGNLYVVNFAREGTIGIVDKDGLATHFVDLPAGSIGNGIRFDSAGLMYVADYKGHNVLRIDPLTKTIEVYAHEPKMHQPNDIAITASGIIYASDPDWSNNSGQLWLISPSKAPLLLETGMGTTNGIEVSVDDKHLYVNESVQRKVWIYDINPDFTLANKRLFYQFADHGLDGMRSDIEGNLYVARYGAGRIAVLSKEGELSNEIMLSGAFPTNVAFGGEGGRKVFVTLQKMRAIDTFEAPFAGRSFQLSHTH
jgi:gluconolactonase